MVGTDPLKTISYGYNSADELTGEVATGGDPAEAPLANDYDKMDKYWDKELSDAKAREYTLKQQAKKLATEGKLKPAEEQATFGKLRAENLDERERKVLDNGISNFEFHYLGSAKILGGIGKGFAEAMADLKGLRKSNP